MFVGMFFGENDLNALADAELTAYYKSPMTVRQQGADNSWENGIKAYNEERFPAAIASIQRSLEKNNKKVDEKNLYLGLSHLYSKVPNLEKAITSFEKCQDSVVYGKQAKWFMGLAHLKLGNTEEARALIQQVADMPDDWKRSEAAALLNRF